MSRRTSPVTMQVATKLIFCLFCHCYCIDPTGKCPAAFDASAGKELAPEARGGSYTWPVPSVDAPTTFWLVCQVSDHCAEGQKVQVQVTCPKPTAG